jgi:hypothetical protein
MKLPRPGDKIIAANCGEGWGTPTWEMFRKLNFELAEKGADITRIFVEPEIATPEDKELLKQEMDRQKGHIKVRFLKESELPHGANLVSNLIVDRYFITVTMSKPAGRGLKEPPNEITVYTRRDQLEKAKETMETLIKLSEEYK